VDNLVSGGKRNFSLDNPLVSCFPPLAQQPAGTQCPANSVNNEPSVLGDIRRGGDEDDALKDEQTGAGKPLRSRAASFLVRTNSACSYYQADNSALELSQKPAWSPAGIGERTANRRWADPAFRKRVGELRAAAIERATGKLADGMAGAAATLRKLLRAKSEVVRAPIRAEVSQNRSEHRDGVIP
jgi:hypothetical protein